MLELTKARTGRLEGKVALVSGAASGLGAATSRLMVEEGARVVLADLNLSGAQQLASELGTNSLALELDVTDEAKWRSAVSRTVERFGGLNILVNNAGISPHDSIEDIDYEQWRRVHRVVLEGIMWGLKVCVPAIAQSGGGAIVNTSSIAGEVGASSYSSYGAAKAGVRNLSRSTAMYCAEKGYPVRCNAVLPGSIDTPILDADKEKYGQAAVTNREKRIPMGRLGQAIEVAHAILFLASDEASYITGTELIVDGGVTAR